MAPYVVPIVRSVSQINGKSKPNFSAKALFAAAVSNETPRMTAPFAS